MVVPEREHVAFPTKTSVRRYGLPLDDADDEDADDPVSAAERPGAAAVEGTPDGMRHFPERPNVAADDTQQHVEMLCSSPAFRRHGEQRGWGHQSDQLQHSHAVATRLRVYGELRDVDPDGFQRLWRRGVMLQHDCSPASCPALAADYVLTAALTAAVAAGLATAWYRQVRSQWPVCAALVWAAANVVRWRRGRPVFGPLMHLWWEETRWGHRAPFTAVLVAAIAEALYVVATLGLGSVVSLAMRCTIGQSLGERAAGIRLAREVTRRL